MQKEYLEVLNERQREAVQHIEGPLLVVAGPGTGKTQLLSSRVAYILEQTDTDPSAILCLTFTNKAALNMHERIIQITGGQAHNVAVRTFHSFAAEIMSMYPDYFWNGARLSTAPDAVQQDIIETILTNLPLDNPLAMKFAGSFTQIGDVKKSLQLIKEAGLTPDKLKAIIMANLSYIDTIELQLCDITQASLSYKKLPELLAQVEDLPDQPIDEQIRPLISLSTELKDSLRACIQKDEGSGKTAHTGKWKRDAVQTVAGTRGMFKERERNRWWLELATVYETYRSELHARGYYDYADMLVEVLSQIELRDDLRADIQERYLYVMIDEFQDTNAAQLRLAHLVADHHSAGGNPSIMVVGDDDQSIFKFNGAELDNLLSFSRSYPSTKKIVLTENYRSNQAVLDIAEQIISQASDRLTLRDPDIKKQLTARSSFDTSIISHLGYRTADEQFCGVADHIKKAYHPDKTTAVLARSHQSLRRIAAELIGRGVPVHYEQQQNILEHPLIEQVVLLAQICQSIQQGDIQEVNRYLALSLRHPMWQIAPRELWQLAIDNYHDADWLSSLENHDDERLVTISQLLLQLAHTIDGEPLPVALEYLLGLKELEDELVSPVRQYFISYETRKNLQSYLHGLSALHYLRSCSVEFSSDYVAGLQSFVDFIELQKRNEVIVTDESPFVSGEDAVSLLTVHKAKGLEFDHVYIVDATTNNWKPRVGGRKAPRNLPLQPNGDDMDDYIRLMFVATTRAKQNLTFTSYRFDDQNKDILATPIISTILPDEPTDCSSSPAEILETSLAWPRLDHEDERLMLKRRLENYSLSVTHLLNFLDISSGGPQLFLERNLLRIPEGKSSTLAHGTATHAALEHAQKLVNQEAFSLDAVKEIYSKALEREYLSHSEHARYLEHGHKLLDKLFNDNFLQLQPGSTPEQNISNIFVGSARISGKLDRIDDLGDTLMVSDYKTGKPLSSFSTKDKTLEVKAWKQRMQLVYYAILLDKTPHIKTTGKELSGQMIYLDADNPQQLYRSYTPSNEEMKYLSRLIEAVWQRIISLDLPDISSYSPDYAGIQAFEAELLRSTSGD